MRTIWTAGILTGVLVVLWTLVMGYAGWYRDPALAQLFWMVVLIQIGMLLWALRKTAAAGRRYGAQVLAGLLISVIAGVIVIGGSLLFTTVLFPHYFQELATIQEEMMREAGNSEAQIRAAFDATTKDANPWTQALSGCIGTVATGLLASIVMSPFHRAK